MTGRISTPNYSSSYHDGTLYVRLDQTNPQTGEVRSFLVIPDQLAPADKVGYVDFMINKAQKDQEKLDEDVKKTAEYLREAREEREELAKEFAGIVENLDKLLEKANTPPVDLQPALPNRNDEESFFAPVAKVCSYLAGGIKSFFIQSGAK